MKLTKVILTVTVPKGAVIRETYEPYEHYQANEDIVATLNDVSDGAVCSITIEGVSYVLKNCQIEKDFVEQKFKYGTVEVKGE